MSGEERLQKVLARAGVASRRASERLITGGRVKVNGKVVTELGTKVSPRDEIRVDDRTVLAESLVYFAFHKPPQMITSLDDPEGRPAVGDLAERIPERVFPVGRLDWDAEGLLILTNDGELTNALSHPRYEVPRVYDAKVKGEPTDDTLDTLRAGVRLEDGMAKPKRVERSGKAKKNTWIRVEVTEGRPHLVKRLFEAVGHPVQRLRRIAYAELELGSLPAGDLRELTDAEVAGLKRAAGPTGKQKRKKKSKGSPEKGGRNRGAEKPTRRTKDRASGKGKGRSA